MPAFDAIPDAWIEPDKPVKQELMEAYVNRDDNLKTTNAGANADDLREAYDTGHGHTGAAGDGKPIPAAGIATGGVWKAAYVADDALEARTIASGTMNTGNFADNSVGAAQMTGDATTGMLRQKGLTAGPFFYDATDSTAGDDPIQTIAHSAGVRATVVNIRSPGWFVFEMGSGSMRVAPTNTGTSNSWEVQCDLM